MSLDQIMWFCMVLQPVYTLCHNAFSAASKVQDWLQLEASAMNTLTIEKWEHEKPSMNSPHVFPNAHRDCASSCHLYRHASCNSVYWDSPMIITANTARELENVSESIYIYIKTFAALVYFRSSGYFVDKKHIRPMMTKSKTDRCCGQSTNGASRVVIEVKDAPSTFRVSTAQGRSN